MKTGHLMPLVVVFFSFLAQIFGSPPPGRVLAWGKGIGGETITVSNSRLVTNFVAFRDSPLTNVVSVAAGSSHALALLLDGKVVGWGFDYYGQATGCATKRPSTTNGLVTINGHLLTNVTAIAAGDTFSLALTTNGTVIGWGDTLLGQTDVPPNLTNVIAISAGKEHSLALTRDGTVIRWGGRGSSGVPTDLTNIIAIAAGGSRFERNLALRRDGAVIAWGDQEAHQNAPAWLSNVIAIAVGEYHSLALTEDGTVVGWGANVAGEATGTPMEGPSRYSAGGLVEAGGNVLTDVIAIAAGNEYGMAGSGCRYSLALRKDGSVVAWGRLSGQIATSPAGLRNFKAISAGQNFWLAVQSDGDSPR